MAEMNLIRAFTNALVRTKATLPRTMSPVDSSRTGWWPVIREPFAGAWQRNMEINIQDVLTFSIVWACVTLIAKDISKLWLRLVEVDANGIWTETQNAAFSPVLRTPNHFQNIIQFVEHWILSKLTRGNTYALKQRDGRQVVNALYVLDPTSVTVLVAPDGSVYYRLKTDHLSGIEATEVTVPASEIIHDRFNTIYHPLVGVSPIHACGLAAIQGLKIQNNSEQFFANLSQPGGVLTAPGFIPTETADRIKADWEANYTGVNAGRVAVLGDGLHYEPMMMSAKDAELVQQLKMSGEQIAGCFGVPLWKVGLASMPAYGNVQAANIEYYSTALQQLIESFETCVDHGLGLGLEGETKRLGVEFDISALLRMDSLMQMEIASKGVGSAIFTPNEARSDFGLPPIAGGDDCFLQEQNFSLQDLQRRHQQEFTAASSASMAGPKPTPTRQDEDALKEIEIFKHRMEFRKHLWMAPQPPLLEGEVLHGTESGS